MSFTTSRALPVPALGLAEETGEKGRDDEQVRELRFPVQHLVLSRSDA